MEIIDKLISLTKDGRLVWKVTPGNHIYLDYRKYTGRAEQFKIKISRGYDYYDHDRPKYEVVISLFNRVLYREDYSESSTIDALISEIENGRFGVYNNVDELMTNFLEL